MIATPSGWSAERLEAGLRLRRAADVIDYAERLRPVGRAVELVRSYAAEVGLEISRVHAPTRLVTDEGEHAALVGVEGALAGRPVELVLGLVFLDDYYARIVGTSALRGTVEQLVRKDHHVLGKGRRRVFGYAKPPGWQAKQGLIETSWYPLDYPANPGTITVSLALPAVPGLEAALVQQAMGDAWGTRVPPATTIRTSRMCGTLWHVVNATQPHEADVYLALLGDGLYVYGIRLDTTRAAADAGLTVLESLLTSVEPVPQPREQAVNRTSVAAHWVE